MIREIPIDAVLQLRQKVLWPDKGLDFVRTPNDDCGIHLGIFIEGEWVSCISLFIDCSSFYFERAILLQEES